MIISIHIPKTAGRSLRLRLEASFGARILTDYGDWIGYDTPETIARRAQRTAEMRVRRDELIRDYDLIYGHFIADKYAGLFPATQFTAFFRDPYQQAVSQYQFLLRLGAERDSPGIREFRRLRPSLPEFIAATPNTQAAFLGHVAIEDFAMVGLVEQYDRGVALFEATFRLKLAPESVRANVNPERPRDGYVIDPSVHRAIDTHRAADVELYRRATELFERQAARYGV